MAKQTDTWKIIALVGGGIAAFYFLSSSGTREKIQGTISGILPNITFAPVELSDLALPNMEDILKECQSPDLSDLLPSEWPSLLPSLPDIFNLPPGDTSSPPDHATWADVAYSLPSWAKGTIGVVGAGLAGYGGYQVIRFGGPVLKQIGTQSARAIGGAGNLLKNLFTRSVATRASGTVVKNVPTATAGIRTGGVLGGILPAIAFTGIIEGGYQIFRTAKGEANIGLTGVPPIDIYNLITGKSALFTKEPVPNLLLPSIEEVGAATSEGGAPLTVAPSIIQRPAIAPFATRTTTEQSLLLPELIFASGTTEKQSAKIAPSELPGTTTVERQGWMAAYRRRTK